MKSKEISLEHCEKFSEYPVYCKNKPVYKLTFHYGAREEDTEILVLCEECHEIEVAVCKKFSYTYISEIIDPTFRPSKKRKYTKRVILPKEESKEDTVEDF